ncbi:MAG: transporter, partial [Chthoniobacterales bacterium]
MKIFVLSSATALLGIAISFAGESDSASPTPTPDKSHYTIFNPTPVSLRRAYNTDRPSVTDSPYTIDAGAFQIESDIANWRLDYEDGVRLRTWVFGNTNFK